jgi:hypothetical protein
LIVTFLRKTIGEKRRHCQQHHVNLSHKNFFCLFNN